MAAVDTTRTALSGRTVGGRLTQFSVNLLGSLRAWNDARLTRKALLQLSDRELDDIGLRRADIADFVATLSK